MVSINGIKTGITAAARELKVSKPALKEFSREFKEAERIAYDGAYEPSVYDAIRAHMYPQIFSDYSVGKAVVKGKSNDTFKTLEHLNKEYSKKGKEIRLAPIGTDSVRGRNIVTMPKEALEDVKQKGIQRIVDLRAEVNSTLNGRLNIKDGVQYVDGLEYVHVPVSYKDGLEDLNSIKAFPKFFDAMDKGHVYIGCNQGSHRTDFAVALNYALNTPTKDVPPILYLTPVDVTNGIKRIYKKIQKMSPSEKQALGLTDEFMAKLPKDKDVLNERLIKITNATKEAKEIK